MRSLPFTLGARLLPVAALTAAGLVMTTTGHSDARDQEHAAGKPAAEHPSPSADPSATPSATAPARARYAGPPADPCAGLSAGTVKELVPGGAGEGDRLSVNDSSRRSGCSWHALDGYDYHWLDITYDVSPPGGGRPATAEEGGETISGIGDSATIRERLTTEDGQQSREAVVVVHADNAVVTVTYNGSDFDSGKAPTAATIREGALSAVRQALHALR